MKEIRRSRRVLAGMLAVMMVAGAAPASLYEGGFLAGTAITASADETEVPQIKLSANKYNLVEGASWYIYLEDNQYGNDLTWESSDPNVVVVTKSPYYSDEVEILALSEGTATITVKANDGSGAIGTCTVNVRKYGKYTFTYGEKAFTENGQYSQFYIRDLIYELYGVETETIDNVEFSDEGLFEVKDGYLYINKAFSGTKTLKVKSNDNEYDIDVTFASPDIPQFKNNKYIMYKNSGYGFDVQGISDGRAIQTTCGNGGYKTRMQVGENDPISFDKFEYGKQYVSDGVTAEITAKLYGKSVNIIYTLTNTTNETKVVKIGSWADVQIGEDDSAPCSFTENGIRMVDDSNTNEFKLIPGDGNFTTRWYGYYYEADDNVFVNRDDTSVFSKDSGIAWSWTIEIPAGETVTKTASLSAGEVGVSQVIYDANGGTGDMDPTVDLPEEKVNLNTNNYVKDGYAFMGWDTDSAGTTVVYADGADFTIPETDTVLYAVWEKNITKEPEAISPLVYNGGGQDLITAGEVKEGKLVYAMGDDEETAPEADAYSENIPGAVDAGNYYVWYEVVNDDNLVIAKPACIETVIEKADPVFTAPTANELTEDGTVQELITTSDCDGGDMLFAMTTDAETTPDEDAFGDEIPTADESGTYYVWYKVKGDKNHNDSEPACVTVTVAEGNWLIGDVNNDGKINVTDIAMAAAHVKGKRMLTKDKFKRADVNFDGVLDVSDITLIAAHVKGKKMLLQKNEIPQTEETPQTEEVSQTEEEA